MIYPNGLDANIAFEAATGRLRSLVHQAGSLAAPVASFSHAYDSRGDLTSLTELTGTKAFGYDATERLTGVTQQLPAPAAQAESYTYDPEGNRIASHLSPAYVTDAANHLLDDGINAYAWDPSGFLTSRTPKNGAAATAYRFNFYGLESGAELQQITGPFPLQFAYDNFQRLNLITWNADPSKGGYGRHYDGQDMVLEERNAYQLRNYGDTSLNPQSIAVPISLA